MDGLHKALTKLNALTISVAGSEGWFDVFVEGEETPYAFQIIGREIEIMRYSPSGCFHFVDTARDIPELARKLVAIVQGDIYA